jgi:hypothetical protein
LSEVHWSEVRWTEACQITELMGHDEADWPAPGVEPRAHFLALREAGARAEAAAFLGHALQRLEALAWACRILEQEAAGRALPLRDRQALDHALRWLGEPTDEHRRAAYEAAEAARDSAPERVLATAVFLSGGSLSLPDLPPVPPPPELAGRVAGVAVVMAAARSERRDEVLDRALDIGDKIAKIGARSLEST